ncbi:MAG: exodeoxyribonuclease VII large subunit [Bacilli bacterium]|nr:exodeoxyribonuclease VII large subunit [Bacilli bacterium]
MENKYLTVGALTRYIKYKIDNDEHLKTVFLKGEISNFKMHSTGHMYFSIKDETSKINAIMFSSSAKKITFSPMDGTKVLVIGRISVYEATGNYQIYVSDMQEDGVGNLYIAFEKLKEKLKIEGLFDDRYKKAIPKIPKRIGIITAPTGAAIKDILSTIKRRFPICETILFPSLVQGENASNDIVRNLRLASTYDLDVIILGRGGGSIEDLWPFNEEIVAREIFNTKIPIISAVGHEVDFTIADFVADLRAPTPTGAAEMAVPNMVDLINYISQLRIRLNESMNKKVNYQKLVLDNFKNSFVIKNPMIIYENKRQKIDLLKENFNNILVSKLEHNKNRINNFKNNYILNNPSILYDKHIIKLDNIIEKLKLVNPLDILKRGYSITSQDDRVIKSIKDIRKDKLVTIKLYDGLIDAVVKEIK